MTALVSDSPEGPPSTRQNATICECGYLNLSLLILVTLSPTDKVNDTATASILRTHLQCQRLGANPRPRGRSGANIVSSSPGMYRKDGGAYRDRTDDLMLAKQPLSQLS
jgi:hypothetical protein